MWTSLKNDFVKKIVATTDVLTVWTSAYGFVQQKKAKTVFDVDKVVEQIKSIKGKEQGAYADQQCGFCDYFNDCGEVDMSYKLTLDKAIEIVKGGGVE